MIQLKSQVTQLIDEATAACRVTCPDAPILHHEIKLRAQLQAYQPTLMFFGQYNAGKSTLINALLAEGEHEVAPTSDAPCTSEITEYTFGDYTVFDTPGIQAPEEHERVSRDKLKEAHAVVFVMNTGGTHENLTMVNEIVEIWRSGRAVLVALNDRQGYDFDSPDVARIVDKLCENLVKVAQDPQIEADVPVVLVNARTGWKARKYMAMPEGSRDRNKGDLLFERSKVGVLADEMHRALIASSSSEALLRPTLLALIEALEETEVAIQTSQSKGSAQASYYEGLRALLTSARRDFEDMARLGIEALQHELAGDLLSAIRAQMPLELFFESYSDKADEQFQHALRHIQSRLRDDFESFGQAQPHIHGPDFAHDASAHNSSHSFKGGFTFDAGKASEFFKSGGADGAIKGVLLKLRSWKIPGLKGRWEKTLGRWAGQLGKGLGIGIQVASALYDLHSARAAQLAYQDAKRSQHEQEKLVSTQLASRAQQHVLTQVPSIAYECFEPIEKELEAQLNGSHDASTQHAHTLRTLRQLRERAIAIMAHT